MTYRNVEEFDFPDNVMGVIGNHLGQEPWVDNVVYRGLEPTDANKTLALDGLEWMPDEDSIEIGPFIEPSRQDYLIQVQFMVKDADRDAGGVLHRKSAKDIRRMLYRDEPLAVALRQLATSESGRTESLFRWKVLGQRLASNDIKGTFTAVSVLELQVTTQIA